MATLCAGCSTPACLAGKSRTNFNNQKWPEGQKSLPAVSFFGGSNTEVYGTGFTQRRLGNRLKSRSVDASTAPFSIANAAKAASLTNAPAARPSGTRRSNNSA